MEKYIMALDAGTTSCRCCLFGADGRIRSIAQRELPQRDADWEKAVGALKGRLPPGIYMLLGDPMQVSGTFSGDTLTLSCANDFAMNNINRPDVSSRIASAVGESLGRTLRVEVKRAGETPAEEKPQPQSGKLDELSKFDIVTIK